MEAFALYPFTGNPSEGELIFDKGDALKILSMSHDGHDYNWMIAECRRGKQGLIPAGYVRLNQCKWFWDTLSREGAERLLMAAETECGFIVRQSSCATPGNFSLSVKEFPGIQHYKIKRDTSGRYDIWGYKCETVNELVEFYRHNSVSKTKLVCLKEINEMVQAKFNFTGKENDELSFMRTEWIKVLSKENPNWWFGQKQGGQRGLFPTNHVRENPIIMHETSDPL